MRGRLLLSTVGVLLAAVVLGWAALVGRGEPADPELGPAARVRLSPVAVAPSQPLPSATGGSSTTPSAASDTPTTAPTARVIPPTAAPSTGAQTVPRHSPLPAGDEDDDDPDDDPDDDDDDD